MLPSRVNQRWQYTGIDSYDCCVDKAYFKSYPYKIEYVYNSRGFRDQEWPTDISDLQNAVWCIGDSFTVGLGSPIEHTWPYQVGQTLDKRIINVSMDGASNHWIARKALDIVNIINPATIIIQWSYIHRYELNDPTLTDEDRRQHFDSLDYNDLELGRKFLELIKNLESKKQNTNIIHSFIPKFGIKTDIEGIWKQIAGKDWPIVPPSLVEFKNLDKNIVDELVNDFKLYEVFELYYQLFYTIKYVPEIRPLDRARDGHHYDILTAKKFAVDVKKLLLDVD